MVYVKYLGGTAAYTKHCTKVNINQSCVRMPSAGKEQAGTLLMSRSAAIQNHGVDR